MNKDTFLNSKEAASFLGLSYKQLRNLTSSGRVPYYKFGRLNRYKLDELVALITSNPRGRRDFCPTKEEENNVN